MLRTAPPETIEQAHAEAFAQLTPDQRRMVLQNLGAVVPPGEQATSDDPQSLARMATRAEMRQPGTLERTFSTMPGPGMGGLMAGSFLSSMAGVFLGTMIAQSFFGGFGGGGYDFRLLGRLPGRPAGRGRARRTGLRRVRRAATTAVATSESGLRGRLLVESCWTSIACTRSGWFTRYRAWSRRACAKTWFTARSMTTI